MPPNNADQLLLELSRDSSRHCKAVSPRPPKPFVPFALGDAGLLADLLAALDGLQLHKLADLGHDGHALLRARGVGLVRPEEDEGVGGALLAQRVELARRGQDGCRVGALEGHPEPSDDGLARVSISARSTETRVGGQRWVGAYGGGSSDSSSFSRSGGSSSRR